MRQPWWASDHSTTAAGFDDPVTAHRAARRGTTDDRLAGDPVGGQQPHDFDTCGVCPICAGLRVLGETRPELLHHLSEAARHVAAAVRSVLDDLPSQDEAHAGPFEHIDLDEDLDVDPGP